MLGTNLRKSELSTTVPSTGSAVVHRDIDLLDVLCVVWKGRWIVFTLGVILAIVGALYGLLAQSWYRAEVVVVRAENQQLPSLGQLGGLAALAGVNLDSGADPLSVVVLNSREIVREFIEANNLLPILFVEKWDEKAQRWREGERSPEVQEAVDFFRKRVRDIVEDNRRGEIRVGIRWTNPELAAIWANEFVQMVNEKLRDRALEESTRNVAFLRDQMAATDIPALQQALGRAVESEMQKVMLAKGGDEYAFIVVDRAVKPRFRDSPRRLAAVLVGFSLGAGIGVLIALMRGLLIAMTRKA